MGVSGMSKGVVRLGVLEVNIQAGYTGYFRPLVYPLPVLTSSDGTEAGGTHPAGMLSC